MKLRIEYIAGIVDGEGCLAIAKLRVAKEHKRGVRFNPILSIANTHIPLLQAIQAQIGGRIRVETGGVYALHLNASEIRSFLPRVKRYLLVKREQAEVLLAYLNQTLANGPRPISDKTHQFYDKCFREIRDLKKVRYVYDATPWMIRQVPCPTCKKVFVVYSNRPGKMYCNDYCKRKADWTRSNARIRDGRPAWGSLRRDAIPESSASSN